MTDYANRVSPYDWSDATRAVRFNRLIGIIRTHSIANVGFSIPTGPYYRYMSAHAQHITGGPYGLAALCCWLETATVLDPLYPSARIAYVFESGTEGSGQVLKAFEWNKADPSRARDFKLLSIRFEDKKVFVPLQAADILAYELYRHLPKQIGLDPYRSRRETRALLNASRIQSWCNLDETEIKKWAQIIELADDWDKK